MGRVTNKPIKNAAKEIIEKHYERCTKDFQTNKRLVDEVAVISSKKVRNQIAGYITRLMKRLENGPVKGISIQAWEEERERRDNIAPKVSILDRMKNQEVDPITAAMLKMCL